MVNLRNKLFVQLKLHDEHLEYVLAVQNNLMPNKCRLVTSNALHMTIIHIGRIEKLIHSLKAETKKSEAELLDHVQQLVANLKAIVAPYSRTTFALKPNGIEKFGASSSTLVVTFHASPLLIELHKQSFDVLNSFLNDCGVHDVTTFLAGNDSLRYVAELRPHLTIAKSYHGPSSSIDLAALSFKMMPVVY